MRRRYGNSFSVKLPPVDMAFLRNMKAALGKASLADVLRETLCAFRTLFNLPPYQAERLQVDMHSRGLNRLEYVQELLARRYEVLAREREGGDP